MAKIENIQQATAAFHTLRPFIGASQIEAMADVCRGEERRYMFSKLSELVDTVQTMPKTYETDGQGDAAIVRLHYFVGGCDWYITERDMLRRAAPSVRPRRPGHGLPGTGIYQHRRDYSSGGGARFALVRKAVGRALMARQWQRQIQQQEKHLGPFPASGKPRSRAAHRAAEGVSPHSGFDRLSDKRHDAERRVVLVAARLIGGASSPVGSLSGCSKTDSRNRSPFSWHHQFVIASV
jgi:hypothetical protein